MAFDSRDLVVKINGDTSGFEKSMKNVKSASDNTHLSFLKLTGAVAAGQAAFELAKVGITKAVGFLGDTVKSANDSENALAQLNTVLKSTSNAAGIASKDLVDQATALQKLTTYSDEAVMSAQSLLLTFTNVKGGVFKEAIPTILDMSTALGQDLKSSSIQLGKALNDPIKGITALSRVGVSFTQAQKDQIETLVKSGKTMEAQKIILKELKTEFGGSAAAAGQTFAGSMLRLKNQIDDVQESIGTAIVKAITPFTQKAADFIASVDWEVVIERSQEALRNLWRELAIFFEKAKAVYQQVESYLEPKFIALWHTLQEKVVPVLVRLWKEVIQPLAPVIGTVLVVALGAAIDAVNALFTVLMPLINWMLSNKNVVLELAAAFTVLAVAMKFGAIVSAFQGAMAAAAASATATWGSITALIGTPIVVPALIIGAAIASINSIKQAWNDVLNAQKAAASLGSDAQVRELQKQAAAARAVGDTKKVNQIANAIAALSGGRADGGPVTGGKSYLVGERGPEIFTPGQSGSITPNHQLGGSINITVNMGMYAGLPVERREIAKAIWQDLTREARSNGVQLPIIQSVGVQ